MFEITTDEDIRRSIASPWTPPASLSAESLKTFEQEPRIWLSEIIRIMSATPANREEDAEWKGRLVIESTPAVSLKDAVALRIYNTIKRRRAARALFEAIRLANDSFLIGTLGDEENQPIPSKYFDIARNLGDAENTIATDMDVLVDDPRWSEERHSKPWRDVRIDGPWILRWLSAHIDPAAHAELASPPLWQGYSVAAEVTQMIWSQPSREIARGEGTDIHAGHAIPAIHAPRASRRASTPLQTMILEISERWLEGDFPARVKDRNEKIRSAWPKDQAPPNDKTIQRAFAKRTK